MFINLSSPYCPYFTISHVYTFTLVCTGILPLSEISIRALWAYSWFGPSCCPSAWIELDQQEMSQDEDEKSKAGDTEYSGAAIIYSVIKRIVRGTESVREQSD